MNCVAGVSDAVIMQMKMEGTKCSTFIGLTAAELCVKLGLGEFLDLTDLDVRLNIEGWNKLTACVSDNRKTCEICWHSIINTEFTGDRT